MTDRFASRAAFHAAAVRGIRELKAASQPLLRDAQRRLELLELRRKAALYDALTTFCRLL